ncbi:LLM class flavin-dependent oxidoreductase [Shinella daejeonensis]|uniref:LLM class flavin-dependent oxidoreductase n=1 Tax=Shinella daejeonensis TaxID=659017 RepID=UPI0020C797C2|nr:LLM class flavin-dependent oxidoreductase [Shinella daejeonensis]MCP8894569.1 LLM class flavin-dependent oxidoreductase [Shinella daejeonensis]
MAKRLVFNAFVNNAVSHIYHGLWRHPDARQSEFTNIDMWKNLAGLLERGKFDCLFVADVTGMDGIYKGSPDLFVKEAIQIPINDSGALCSALVGATENLGLVFTSSMMQEHPFNFAKRVATLDHLSRGRIGWNIVTGISNNAARNFGFDKIVRHDERYAWAEEYLDVLYKLWEGSWDEGAILDDKETGVYADPSKVHRINHVGNRYKVAGPQLSSPSPQRIPILYQAGTSSAGRAFAASNAEGTFLLSINPEGARKVITEMRAAAEAAGRRADDIQFVQGLSFVVGSTEAEASRKSEELDQWLSEEGLLAHVGRDMGIDLGMLDPDQAIDDMKAEGVQGHLKALQQGSGGKRSTVRDIGRLHAHSTRVVGTPEQIADKLTAWQEAGVDGINVMYQLMPNSFQDFVEHVTPVLQKRGLVQTEYASGTLREKLFPGRGPVLNDRHPAARYRGAFRGQEA